MVWGGGGVRKDGENSTGTQYVSRESHFIDAANHRRSLLEVKSF